MDPTFRFLELTRRSRAARFAHAFPRGFCVQKLFQVLLADPGGRDAPPDGMTRTLAQGAAP